jgi:protein-tyrosine-phosphatase/DNA-binding transcriptional ArsR family regulator
MGTPQTYSTTSAPPEFLQLAGHPLRWRLLSELARSDRAVNELTDLVGEPQNLVSYHLAKLRDGRLVSARRSSADGRDSYYRLDLARIGALLSETGAALHPALHLVVSPRKGAPIPLAKVLFLCTGNSARSPMAAALARSHSIDAYSAGSDPKPLHANALRVMKEEFGIDISGHKPRHLDTFAGRHFDVVISLCDKVREVCPEFPGNPETIHWSISNPATGDADGVTYPLFQQTAMELTSRIEFLLAVLRGRAPAQRQPRRRSR